jgi:hypothetical protein
VERNQPEPALSIQLAVRAKAKHRELQEEAQSRWVRKIKENAGSGKGESL